MTMIAMETACITYLRKPTYRPRPERHVAFFNWRKKRKRFGIRFYTAQKDVIGINEFHRCVPNIKIQLILH